MRFGGSIGDLTAARAVTDTPLLGKGFFSTEEHLLELRDAGADAVLLLLRDLDDATAARLLAYTHELGLDALVEAHNASELERALRLEAPIVGVNARDLSTFRIDREQQLTLVARAAENKAASSSRSAASTPARRAPPPSWPAPTRCSSARR